MESVSKKDTMFKIRTKFNRFLNREQYNKYVDVYLEQNLRVAEQSYLLDT